MLFASYRCSRICLGGNGVVFSCGLAFLSPLSDYWHEKKPPAKRMAVHIKAEAPDGFAVGASVVFSCCIMLSKCGTFRPSRIA